MHQNLRQPGGDDSRACLIASVGGASHQRKLLGDPHPVTGEHIPPEIVRIPVERPTSRFEFTAVVHEDRPGDYLECSLPRQRKPVDHRHPIAWVESEPRSHKVRDRADVDMVTCECLPAESETRGMVPESFGKRTLELTRNLVHRLRGDEEAYPRAPVVVTRHRIIQSEDVRPCTQAPR